jgi:hypothetical protein
MPAFPGLEMPRKPTPKPDNPEQYKRFLKTAREAGADEPGEAFDRVLDRVARTRPASPAKPKGSQKG